MLCTIALNEADNWTVPEWLARNFFAHLEPFFVLAKSRVEERFADLLAGRAQLVDLSNASAAEMGELLRVAEFARTIVKRSSEWAEPAAALEFVAEYDRFLNLLRMDKRVRKN